MATARELSTDEVLERWTQLFMGLLAIHRDMPGESMTRDEHPTVRDVAAIHP